MVRITEDLIRKKAEHHEGVLPELEELTLHQMEIEKIEVVGSVCRKLQILYLQNNIISKMENLHHLHSLKYLNLALNNLTKIEGLSGCEFLSKLDLTVNFIDMDTFEESINELRPLLHMRELFLMGNPCTLWEDHRDYVAAMLPQLQQLDGKEFSRADRIQARQKLASLRPQLHELANAVRYRKGLPQEPYRPPVDDDEAEAYTPESRTRMYREMAEQKEEQEARRKAMEPRDRDYQREHDEAVAKVRAKEAGGSVRQTNEGRWDFFCDDEDGKGNVVLRLSLSRFLDTSLVDVDVHPTFVSVVSKGKTFRLLWPEEVRAGEGSCQRSQTTGELVITVPKVRQGTSLGTGHGRSGRDGEAQTIAPSKAKAAKPGAASNDPAAPGRTRLLNPSKPMKLADELAALAGQIQASGADRPPPGTAQASGYAASSPAGGQARPAVASAPAPAQPIAPDVGPVDDNDEVPPLE